MSTKFVKIITILLIPFLLFLIGYIFIIKNLHYELIIAEQNKDTLNKNLAKKQIRINNSAIYQQQISKLNDAYAVYEKQLNLNITVPLLLDQLAKIGKLNNVTLKTVQPLPLKQKDWLILHPMQLVVIGSYHQLGQIITTLVDTFYFIDLPNVKLTKLKGNQNDLIMQVLCIIYSKN